MIKSEQKTGNPVLDKVFLREINEVKNLKDSTENSEEIVAITFWQLLRSTLSAFIGVQSNANRERDFKHGKISHFIGIGLLFGLVFIGSIVTVVQIVLHVTGTD